MYVMFRNGRRLGTVRVHRLLQRRSSYGSVHLRQNGSGYWWVDLYLVSRLVGESPWGL